MIDVQTNAATHTIFSNDNDCELSLRRDNIEDSKTLNKFIKKCEIIIRSSVEYKEWVMYLYDTMGLYKCQVSGELSSQVSTEVHHHPFTLYNIVQGIVLKKINDNVPFCSFDIATEAIELHYSLKVPFVILIKSMHEKYHNGFLKIPMEMVIGDKEYFINEYGAYLPSDDLEFIEDKLIVNLKNCGWNPKDYNWFGDNEEIHTKEG
jgi:hypothetical protein